MDTQEAGDQSCVARERECEGDLLFTIYLLVSLGMLECRVRETGDWDQLGSDCHVLGMNK